MEMDEIGLMDTGTELSIESTGWGAIMLQSMHELRQAQILCDISVVVQDGSVLMAHGLVLSAGSSFFKDILQKARMNGNSIIVKCHFSRKTMEFIIDFLYEGKISPNIRDLKDIMKAAETFGIQALVTFCQVFKDKGEELSIVTANPDNGKVTEFVFQQGNNEEEEEPEQTNGETMEEVTESNPEESLLPVEELEAAEFEEDETMVVYNNCITTEIYDENTSTFRKTYRYPCDECGRQFTSRGRLLGHKATHKGEKVFRCGVCSETFIQMEYLKEHVTIHTEDRPFKCEFCNHAFRVKRHLNKHMSIHTGERPFACEYCGNTFRRSDAYKNHLRIHTGERPYSCRVCSKKFRLMETLRRHMCVHSGKRPFKCTQCPRTYRQRAGLLNHQLIHSGRKPYLCQVEGCPADFRLKKQLERHLYTIHNLKIQDLKLDRLANVELAAVIETGEEAVHEQETTDNIEESEQIVNLTDENQDNVTVIIHEGDT